MANKMAESRCRASGSTDLRTIIDFGEVPLADVLLEENREDLEDAKYPLHLVFCPESALVQITHDVPPEILWGGNYPYYTSVNPTLVQHFTEAAEEIMRAKPLGPGSVVLEAASNDGYQLEVFQKAGAKVLGIDPAEGPARIANEKGVETQCRLFDLACASELEGAGLKADIIVGNNVLNLIPDPKEFTACIDRLLKPDGMVVLEVPYLVDTIDIGAFDNVYHQNVTYWTVTSLQRLFQDVGMRLVDVKRIDTFGGSLRAYFQRGGSANDAVAQELLTEHRRGVAEFAFYEAFGRKAMEIRNTLRERMIGHKSDGKRLVAYGAAGGMATTLLAFLDLPEGTLDYAVDLSPHKHGKWTSGCRLQIYPPEFMDEDGPDFALLLAWNFEPQVLSHRGAFTGKGGKFIVPIPEVHEVP